MTVGFWVLFGLIAVIGLVIVFAIWAMSENALAVILAFVILVGCLFGVFKWGDWYYTETANGIRAVKDEQSNFNNGLNREIIITAEDGREICYHKGKCDIEHNDGYILFETEEGKRVMIYYGVTDTIIITEY